MRILAIDPGTTESAFVILDDGRPVDFAKIPNWSLLEQVRRDWVAVDRMAVEMIASYGMPVGKEVFETVLFIGRLIEAWKGTTIPTLVYRREVKIHLCGSMKAKDGNIRQALVDRFGGEVAIGKKKTPGPLYGIAGDVWSALAVAVTFAETGIEKV